MTASGKAAPEVRAPKSHAPPPVSAHWIAWSHHRRTAGLCAAWDMPLHVLRPARSGPERWLELSYRTLTLLGRERPDILFVQNPSLALTVLAVVVRPVFRYKLVVDAHNEGIRPYDRPYAPVRWLTRRLLRSADTTIVSNEALAADVRSAGGRPLVLSDRLPIPEPAPVGKRKPEPADVVVIATYRPDEPIAAIMAAAAGMRDVSFAFSGPADRYRRTGAELPPNVRLTGYLNDADYWTLLARATVVCDLTLKPDCLVCGAYEALAVGKAMVLSDNPATRELFGPAAVVTGNEPAQIAAALRFALERCDQLAAAAVELRKDYAGRWCREAAAVWAAVVRDGGPRHGRSADRPTSQTTQRRFSHRERK